jgi:8-oxo-dGTP pyrophosphatase MutT (NUDIX family)
MQAITKKWRVINSEPSPNIAPIIRQVYVWLITSDNHVVIVSKDGLNWQLPGGKPDNNESPIQTAVRETAEETGVDISNYVTDLHFFGEYIINDQTDINPPKYRQVRAWLKLPATSAELNLSTCGESSTQRQTDAVRFVRTVSLQELPNVITWLAQSDEYKALKRNGAIYTS